MLAKSCNLVPRFKCHLQTSVYKNFYLYRRHINFDYNPLRIIRFLPNHDPVLYRFMASLSTRLITNKLPPPEKISIK